MTVEFIVFREVMPCSLVAR